MAELGVSPGWQHSQIKAEPRGAGGREFLKATEETARVSWGYTVRDRHSLNPYSEALPGTIQQHWATEAR